MFVPPETLGIIAGNRTLPFLLAHQARHLGVRKLVAVAFKSETDPTLADHVDKISWVRVGQLSRMISAFKDEGVRQCVMVGQIAPKNLFDLRPDLRAMALLLRIKERNAHTLFGAIASELLKDGIELIEAVPFLKPHMPAAGILIGRAPNDGQRDDVQYGLRIAKEISRLEIGQTVIVKNGSVLAVEAFEGTDECLRRGGKLAGPKGGAVAVKVAKEGHDFRFDIPCVGARTVEICAEAGVQMLAFEAGKTLLLERDRVEKVSRDHSIGVMAVSNE